MELSKEFTFEASHILPKHKGKCALLHGHSWKLTVSVEGQINPLTGFVLDYAELKKIVEPLVIDLDHKHLGTWDHPIFNKDFIEEKYHVPGLAFDFYPTSENVLIWLAGQLNGLDSWLKLDGDSWDPPNFVIPDDEVLRTNKHYWSRIELNETCTTKCVLTRKDYEARTRIQGC